MTFAVLPLLAACCYFMATLVVSQRLYHAEGPRLKLLFSAATCGVLLHMLGLSQALFTADGQNFSLINVSSLVCWLITFMFTSIALRTPIFLLLPIIYCFATLVQLAAALLPAGSQVQHFEQSPWLLAHIVVALMAYVLLIMATLYSFQVSYISHKLKQKAPLATGTKLPPLMQAESLLFRLVLLGTIMLGCTLISGAMFSDDWFAKHNLHKNVLSFLAFVTYVILLIGHYRAGWRGRMANSLSLVGAVLLTLAYFGARFVHEVLLHS